MPILAEKPTTVEKAETNIARTNKAGLLGRLVFASLDRRPIQDSKKLLVHRESIGAAGRIQEDIAQILDWSNRLPGIKAEKTGFTGENDSRVRSNPTEDTYGSIKEHFTMERFPGGHPIRPDVSIVFARGDKKFSRHIVNDLFPKMQPDSAKPGMEAYCYATHNLNTFIVALSQGYSGHYEAVDSLLINSKTLKRVADDKEYDAMSMLTLSAMHLESVVADDLAQLQENVAFYQ